MIPPTNWVPFNDPWSATKLFFGALPSPKCRACRTTTKMTWKNLHFMHWLGILEVGFALSKIYMGVNPKMVGFPNNHGVFLLKMISTWGGDWGYHHLRKHPYIHLTLKTPNDPCFDMFWLEAASCGGKTSDKWLRYGIYMQASIIYSSSCSLPKTLGKVSKCLMCFFSSTTTTTTTTTGGLAHLESETPFCQVSTRVLGFVIWSWLTSWSKLHDDILANSPEKALPFFCFGNL